MSLPNPNYFSNLQKKLRRIWLSLLNRLFLFILPLQMHQEKTLTLSRECSKKRARMFNKLQLVKLMRIY